MNQAGTLTGAAGRSRSRGFRGIANNVRWAVFDGNRPVEVFADLNIADGKFHHLGRGAGSSQPTWRGCLWMARSARDIDVSTSAH